VKPIASIAPTCETSVMNKLTLTYKHDASFFDPKLTRDDFGRLSISVETERFSGNGGFWVQWQDVKEFGEALGRYPIPEGEPITAQWGFEMQEGDDLILRLEIVPADVRGNLSIRFEIADDFEPHNRLRGSFLTNYSDLDAFRIGIAHVMGNEAGEAILRGQ
jgi:hypothetical protein